VAADQQDWVDHMELAEFCYNNSKHSTTGATQQGQPPSDANEEVPMVTQLDEEKRRLWEMAKANFEKAHKRYKDFADKSR